MRGNKRPEELKFLFRTAPTGSNGFTLLEVLISLAILTIGSTAVIALYSAGLETYRRSELFFTSTNLALEVISTSEELLQRGKKPKEVAQLLKQKIALPPSFRVNVSFNSPSPDFVQINLKVTHVGRGRTRSWTWRREVFLGGNSRLAKLSEKVPRRYVIRAGSR